ncbi:MAG: hypothetical protein RI897_2659 [Verrucomicrobiota bacterium]|jgi:hypothetical protein
MDPRNTRWRRRGFLGGMLVSAGAAAGWVVSRISDPRARARRTPPVTQSSLVYDVSEFEETDPTLLIYKDAGQFQTGLDQVKRLTLWNPHGLAVSSPDALTLFNPNGSKLKSFALNGVTNCLLPLSPDSILVGFSNRYTILDPDGKTLFESPNLGNRTYLTSAATHNNTLYLADAGNREIIIANLQTGEIQTRFGKKDPDLGNPGFNIPSPYFALAVANDQQLRVANTGLLRVETYTLDGRFVSSWGGPGMKIDRFCGCCNPAYFSLTPSGEFVTSEKGLTRINVYHPDGTFKGAVAGPKMLVEDMEQAKRACVDCSVGAGFDITLHPNGEILTLDPYRKVVRRFQPNSLS